MRRRKMLNRVLCAACIALLLFSAVLAVLSLEHDCAGEGCHVCLTLSAWERMRRCMGMAALAAAICFPVRLQERTGFYARLHIFSALTPVRLKVKLSD